MSGFARLLGGAVLALVAATAAIGATGAIADPPPVVHTQQDLRKLLDAGTPTPLDALTPYGKRRFLDQLTWGRKGLGGFGYTPLIRELDRTQLEAVLRFLDSDSYLPVLGKYIVGPPLRLPEPSADVARRLAQLEQFAAEHAGQRASDATRTTTLGVPAILQRYQMLFGERMNAAALKAQPPGDLLPLFDAAALAANDNPDADAFDHLLLVHDALAARGIDTRRTLDRSLLNAMLAARRFEQARTFTAARPHLADKAIPAVVDKLGPDFQGRSVYDYDAAGNTLTRRPVPHAVGTELLMVVGAGCHFSQDALQAIAADAALQERLRQAKLMLITPPHAAIEFGFIADWNAAHPTLPIRVPASPQEWPGVDALSVPEFYVLKDGKVIGKRSGWPAEGNKAAVVALVEAADG
jgi:hypothetical protein